jgi:2-haloacid dehalogenase
MYQAIIFDFDNTLINYNQCEQEALRRTLITHEIIDEQEQTWNEFWSVYDPINWAYWDRRHTLTRTELTLFTFRDALQAYLGHSGFAESLAATYWDTFCNICYFEPGAHEILTYVSSSYRIGMITNGYGESQRRRLRACGIDNFFHSLMISDEVKVNKPDPLIFEMAIKDLQVAREQVLFVGDSLNDDYHGAKNAGIDFCFYNPLGKLIEKEYTPLYHIQELSQLRNIV